MFQQLIALIIIALFLARLFWQKQKNHLSLNEFIFWFTFWIFSAGLVIFIKLIDRLVQGLGFSGSGIEILLYLTVVILFYLMFRLRLKLEKIEKDITLLVKEMALKNKK